MEKEPVDSADFDDDLKSLDDILGDLEQELIADFFYTWREHLEEEDHRKIKSLHGAVLASQQAEKKKKFLGRERQIKSERGRSGSALLEDLRVTVDMGSDDVDGATAKDDDDERGRTDMPDSEDGRDGDNTVAKPGGATLLRHHLRSASQDIIAAGYPCQKELQKAEKKKIMRVVQKIIANIKGKEKREKAKIVLTRITDESKNMGGLMTLLADKMVKTKKVFGANIQEILKNDKTDSEIPSFLDVALSVVKRPDNIVIEGIYRQNGNMALIQALKVDVEKNHLEKLKNEANIHNLTGLIKLFFRELKDPLFNAEWYNKITDFVKKDEQSKEREERKDELKDLFEHMALENRTTLRHLVNHFDEVQRYEDKNLMGAENLAIVFGPTLSRVNPLSKDLAADVSMQNKAVSLVMGDKDCRMALEQSLSKEP